MKNIALAVLAFATLTTGCGVMSTKRSSGNGGSIQRPQPTQFDPASGALDLGRDTGRPELGER